MDTQLGTPGDEFAEKIGKSAGIAIGRLAAFTDQPRAAVDVPADDQNAAPSLEKRLPDGVEERGAINQHRGPGRAFDAPDIVTRAKKAHPASTQGPAIG